MSDDSGKERKNESIRTVAIFFGAITIGLLSYTRDIYSEPTSAHHAIENAVNTFLLLAMLFSLSVAALRQPTGNTLISDLILTLSFYALLVGMTIFIWSTFDHSVSITFTVFLLVLGFAYFTLTDPKPDEAQSSRGPISDPILKYWTRYNGLKRSSESPISS